MSRQLVALAAVQASDPSASSVIAFVSRNRRGALTVVVHARALWSIAVTVRFTAPRVLRLTEIPRKTCWAFALARWHLALAPVLTKDCIANGGFAPRPQITFWAAADSAGHLTGAAVQARHIVTNSSLTHWAAESRIALALIAVARSMPVAICV